MLRGYTQAHPSHNTHDEKNNRLLGNPKSVDVDSKSFPVELEQPIFQLKFIDTIRIRRILQSIQILY